MRRHQRRILGVYRDGRAEEVAHRVRYVSEEVRRLTRRREPIFDFSNQPAFYFFADRMNPTRFYQVPIASPRQFQAEIIRALERTKTKVILRTSPENYDEFDGVPNSVRAQAVAAYIDDVYRFFTTVRGVEIWKRDAEAKARLDQFALTHRGGQPLYALSMGIEVRPVLHRSEDRMLRVAKAWQDATDHHTKHPPRFVTA